VITAPPPTAAIHGRVLGAGAPIAGATVTLWLATDAEPRRLATARSDAGGQFVVDAGAVRGPRGVEYLLARGGIANPGVTLLAVLGDRPPQRVVVDEFTTVASVWTNAQFLSGDVLRGPPVGLRVAAANVRNFVDLSTGGYGTTIQDGVNSTQTPTMATFATLADLLAGCVARVRPRACEDLLYAATPPTLALPHDTLAAAEDIATNPWQSTARVFALLDEFYPVPVGQKLRPAPFSPYLSNAPSAWVLALRFVGGGISGPGKMMFDSRGDAWIADNFLVGAQNQSSFWSGNVSKLAGDGRPLSPMTTGFTGGGVLGPGFGLAIDAHDQPWVTSTETNAISHFTRDGKPLSPPHGYTLGGKLGKMQGIIVAPSGDVWALDVTRGQIVELPKGDASKARLFCTSPDGDPLHNPCKLRAPFHLAIDQHDRIWVSNLFGNWVTRFPAADPTAVQTFSTGYSGSGLAVDSLGNVWVTNRLGNGLHGAVTTLDMLFAFKVNWMHDPDPADRVAKVLVNALVRQTPGRTGGSVSVLRPDGTQAPFSPISGEGITAPWAVAVDGNDNVWVSNFSTDTAGIVELCGVRTANCPEGVRTGQAISPPGGYVGGGLQLQVDIAIAPSGDVWVTNNWQSYKAAFGDVPEALSTLAAGQGVVVFYGLAKPVRTPLIGPPRAP
jgi:hypothetical protein